MSTWRPMRGEASAASEYSTIASASLAHAQACLTLRLPLGAMAVVTEPSHGGYETTTVAMAP